MTSNTAPLGSKSNEVLFRLMKNENFIRFWKKLKYLVSKFENSVFFSDKSRECLYLFAQFLSGYAKLADKF